MKVKALRVVILLACSLFLDNEGFGLPLTQGLITNDQDLREAALAEFSDLSAQQQRDYLPELIGALSSEEWTVQVHAAEALEAMGPIAAPALPALVRILDDELQNIANASERAIIAIGKAGLPYLTGVLTGTEEGEYGLAMRALGALGPAAGEAVPLLLWLMEIEAEPLEVDCGGTPYALGRIGKPALGGLSRLWNHANPAVRSEVLCALVQMESMPDVVPLLIEGLNSKERYQRLLGAWGLGLQGASSAWAAPQLERLLEDADGEVVVIVLTALFRIDPLGARPLIVRKLKSPNASARRMAISLLDRPLSGEEPSRDGIAAILVESLNDPDRGVRLESARALANRGIAADKVVAVVASILRASSEGGGSSSGHETQHSLRILADLGEAARPALPSLLSLVLSADPETRSLALGALEKVDKDQAVDIHAANAARGTSELRSSSLSSLERLDSARAIRFYLQDFKQGDIPARKTAILQLGILAPTTTATLEVYRKGLSDPDPAIRFYAAEGVTHLPEAARIFKQALMNPISFFGSTAAIHEIHPYEEIQNRLIFLLRQCGQHAADAVPVLIEEYLNGSPARRRAAAETLGIIGGGSKPVADVLMAGLMEADPELRAATIKALAALGDSGLPQLAEALRRDDIQVREGAVRALGQIVALEGSSFARELLTRSFGDQSPLVRAAALSQMETNHLADLNQLLAALDDPDQEVRYTGAKLLARRGLLPERTLPELMAAITRARGVSLSEAACSIGRYGAMAEMAVPALIEALGREKAKYCAQAAPTVPRSSHDHAWGRCEFWMENEDCPILSIIEVLGSIGPNAKEVVFALADLLKGAGIRTAGRAEALGALRRIEPKAAAELSLSLKLFDSASAGVRFQAAAAMGAFAHSRTEFEPPMRKLLEDIRPEVRTAALESINAGAMLSWAERSLLDAEASIRQLAARKIGEAGPSAKGMVPALGKALNDVDWGVRYEAANAIGRIGPAAKQAVPDLVQLIAAALDSLPQDSLERKTQPRRLGPMYQGPPGPVTGLTGAMEALAHIGPAADPAMPILAAVLEREGNSVAQDISGDGKSRSDRSLWDTTLATIRAIARRSDYAVAAMLKDQRPNVRMGAAQALVRMEDPSNRAIQALTLALDDPFPPARLAAWDALVRREKGVGVGIEASIRALEDPIKRIRIVALASLEISSAAAGGAIPALRKILRETDEEMRLKSACALARIQPTDQEAIRSLFALAASPDAHRAINADDCLLYTKGAEAELTNLLLRTVDKSTDARGLYATMCLGRRPDLELPLEFFDKMKETLISNSEEKLKYGLQWVAFLGPRAKPVASEVLRIATDSRETWRISAARILVGIDPELARKALLPRLLEELKSSEHRFQIARLARRLGADMKAIIPIAAEALGGKDSSMAIELLRELGKDHPEASLALLASLELRDRWTKIQAADALGQLGEKAGETVPKLTTLLLDPDPEVRAAGVKALEKIGIPEAKAAIERYERGEL